MRRRSIVLLALIACRSEPASTTSVEQRLAAELRGALDPQARPNGQVREYELIAEPAELAVAGEEKLRVWAYNGSVPGPTLRVRLGETIRVRVTNRLPQETTVHWHGVRVPNAMDGVPGLTQPPILPGATFVYEFTPKEAGTFWYHPHVRSSEQVERGLYGFLIVEDRDPPPFSRDLTWVLDDWRLAEDRQIDPRFNTRGDLMHDGRWGQRITVNGRLKEDLRARAGERVRIRTLNAANGRVFVPDFGRLAAKIIAVDGNYLARPIELRGFEIAPGNRVDLDVHFAALASEVHEIVDRFMVRAVNPLARIEVDGVVEQPAAAKFESPARAKVPAWREFAAAKISSEMQLDSAAGGPYGIEWRINGVAAHAHAHTHTHARHDHPATLVMNEGEFYRIRFVNRSYRLHPIHIHGMFFRLLARNDAPVEEPFFRDTVLVHAQETIDIGVVPLDVGRWMLHCHVLEHAEAGMMTTVEVRR